MEESEGGEFGEEGKKTTGQRGKMRRADTKERERGGGHQAAVPLQGQPLCLQHPGLRSKE